MSSIATPRIRNSNPSKTMTTETGCSCLNSLTPKHGNNNLENSGHSKRKNITVSQAISLAAAAASLAVILTALAASYFLTGPWNSAIILSTTGNSFVSTTARSTAYARARVLESTLQASLRGKNNRPSLFSTQENDFIASLSEEYAPIKLDENFQRSVLQQQSGAASAGGDGAWPKVAWLMSFPKYVSHMLHRNSLYICF